MAKKALFIIGSLGLVLGLNIYFRSFPIFFPQLKSQAKQAVEESVKYALTQEVYKKFPQYYSLAKDRIAKQAFQEYRKLHKKDIKKQIQELYLKLKDRYQDQGGQSYLMELDCWHWGRYVENVVKYGHPGDEKIFGRQWDFFMLAPLGSYMHWEQFLYYLSASLYKAFSIFKSVPLFQFLFYLPLLYTAIFIIVLYAFSFSCGRYVAAMISCVFAGLAPIFLLRSCAGWFDTDILNLLFPVLIVWSYALSWASPTLKKRILWLSVSAFFVGLFCFSWTHWWFIALILILYELLSLGCLAFCRVFLKKENLPSIKQHSFSLFFFIISSVFWVLVLSGTQPLQVLYGQVTEAVILNKPLKPSIWPNVYSTVGELRRFGLSETMRSVGGKWLFGISVISMLVLLIRALVMKSYSDYKRASIIILSLWFITMLFAGFRGVRFVVFLLTPLGICLGCGINEVYERASKRKNVWGLILAAAIFLTTIIISVNRGYAAARNAFPLMNDTWYKALNLIKEKTSEDTIINSWWDFGDWFKAVAKRRVIFDGQSQHTPQAYWMAKAMLTGNEAESVSILRMLNNGGNKAFEIIEGHMKDPLESVLLLEYVILLPPDKAQETLKKFLPEDKAYEVMKILFYAPAKAVFLVDDTLPLKIGAISYLGNWNFPKVYIAQNFNSKGKDSIINYLKDLGRDDKEMNRFYQEVFLISTKNLDDWLSQKLQFYGGVSSGREEGGIVYFDNGFVYDPEEKTVKSNSGHIPRSIFVLNNEDELIEKALSGANVIFSILVFQADNGYKSVLLDRELGASVFTRLYFLNGKGLRRFLPFVNAEEENNYLRVFYIAW